ncbi:hypothetical protein [Streptomyces sp. HUAS TT7]|uniref:hypothetical protein n=1 Tax=Streptomyces sp. HUAS TT7 TaxID=3447507 RepID=UPI003F65AAB9
MIPRQRTEQISTDGQDHEARPGERVSHPKSHHGKLTGDQLTQPAEPRIDRVQSTAPRAADGR